MTRRTVLEITAALTVAGLSSLFTYHVVNGRYVRSLKELRAETARTLQEQEDLRRRDQEEFARRDAERLAQYEAEKAALEARLSVEYDTKRTIAVQEAVKEAEGKTAKEYLARTVQAEKDRDRYRQQVRAMQGAPTGDTEVETEFAHELLAANMQVGALRLDLEQCNTLRELQTSACEKTMADGIRLAREEERHSAAGQLELWKLRVGDLEHEVARYEARPSPAVAGIVGLALGAVGGVLLAR